MIGTDALIKGARANGAPNEAAVCRAMKSSKESIVGVVIAVEDFVVSLYFKTGRKKKKHIRARATPPAFDHPFESLLGCHSHTALTGVRGTPVTFPSRSQWGAAAADVC